MRGAKMTEEPKKSNLILTVSLYLLMFAVGLFITIIGPLMPTIMEQFDLTYSQGGFLLTCQGIGGIVAIVLGGIIADFMRKERLIKAAFIIYCATLVSFIAAPSYGVILGLFMIIGASTKMLEVALNAYISDLHPDNRQKYINLLHASSGIGGFVGPLFSSLLQHIGLKWNDIFLIFGILCVAILFYYASVMEKAPDKRLPERSATQQINLIHLILNWKFMILCLLGFVYIAYISEITTWMPTYMIQYLASNLFLSSFSVSVLWIGIVFGRIVYSQLSEKWNSKFVIVLSSLICGVILTLVIRINNPVVLLISIGIAGFLSGAIIPFTVASACNWYPRNTGAVSSVLVFCTTMGWMVVPWIIGIIAEEGGIQVGMQIMGVTPLLVTILALFLPSTKSNKTLLKNK